MKKGKFNGSNRWELNHDAKIAYFKTMVDYIAKWLDLITREILS